MTVQEFAVLAQAPLEQRVVMLTLMCVLASIPVALLVFFKTGPARLQQPVPASPEEITTEEEPGNPCAPPHFSPPPLPQAEESGVPVRHWRAVDGAVALTLVLLLTLMTGVLDFRFPGADASAELTAQAPEAALLSAEMLASNFVFQLALSGMILFYLTKIRGFSLNNIFGARRLSVPAVLRTGLVWGTFGGLAVLIISVLLMLPLFHWLGLEKPAPQPLVEALTKNSVSVQVQLMVMLTAVVGAPLMEELIFRGFLYSTAKRFTHIAYAAVASSVLFAVIHANFMSLIPLTLLGLLFAYVYEKTRSLPVTMVMHGVFNLVQISLMLYGPDLSQSAPQPS